jgi:cyclophilin family peptidyl-prolyl cis-trans isomerase
MKPAQTSGAVIAHARATGEHVVTTVAARKARVSVLGCRAQMRRCAAVEQQLDQAPTIERSVRIVPSLGRDGDQGGVQRRILIRVLAEPLDLPSRPRSLQARLCEGKERGSRLGGGGHVVRMARPGGPLLPLFILPTAAALSLEDHQAIVQIEAQRLPPQALAGFAASNDPATRARAARGLGRMRDGQALNALRMMVGDPSPEVRREAAFALAQTPESEPVVLAALRGENDARTRANLYLALGRQGSVAGIPALTDGLRVQVGFLERPVEAEAAARALGQMAVRKVVGLDGRATAAALVGQLGRFDRDTRRAVGFALARLAATNPDAATTAAILASANHDSDPVVRAFLLRALSGIETIDIPGLAAQIEAVLAISARDVDSGVRIATARAAAKTGWTPVTALLSDPDPGVRREAITAVGALGASGKVDAPGLLLPIANRGASAAASEARRTSGDRRVVEAADAIRAIGVASPGDPKLATWLAVEHDTLLRVAAAEVSVDRVALLQLATKDGEGPVRSMSASRLVDQTPTKDELEALLGAFDPVVQATAADRMATIPEPRLERQLLAAMASEDDPDLLASGARALTLLYGGLKPVVAKPAPDAARVAAALISHADPRIRAAAAPLASPLKLQTPAAFHHVVSAPLDQVWTVRTARVETSRGEVILELFPEDAPVTVWNFASLARDGYFDGLQIHRVVPDFVVQDGDPRGDGTGGPGYTIPDEINPIPYREGVVGMALSGPDTGGSQWFVTLSPQPHLDGTYTVFGRVLSGMPALQAMQPGDRIERIRIEQPAVAATTP